MMVTIRDTRDPDLSHLHYRRFTQTGSKGYDGRAPALWACDRGLRDQGQTALCWVLWYYVGHDWDYSVPMVHRGPGKNRPPVAAEH